MQNELNPNLFLDKNLYDVISKTIEQVLSDYQTHPPKEWMSLKEAAEYTHVSINTFNKFRLQGLKVCEIDGIKRVSKTEINNFLEARSF